MQGVFGWWNYWRPTEISESIKPGWRTVSIQTQSLALRKQKPQETQALAFASSQSWLPLLRPSIPIGWRLRKRQPIGMLGWLAACQRKRLRFLRFSFTQRKRLRLNGNRAWQCVIAVTSLIPVYELNNKEGLTWEESGTTTPPPANDVMALRPYPHSEQCFIDGSIGLSAKHREHLNNTTQTKIHNVCYFSYGAAILTVKVTLFLLFSFSFS